MTKEEAIAYLKSADVTVGLDIKTRTAEALEMAIEALSEERKKGRWIEVEWGKTIFGRKITNHKCSICNNYLDFNVLNCGRGRAWFCPNCGAEMEGGGNE